jgi:hypothetical protein
LLEVSDAFMQAIAAPRRRILGRVIISYSDPFMDESVEVSSNEQAEVSYVKQACDTKDKATRKWASCDGSCVPDGTYYPCPSLEETVINQMGWWGSSMSDENGNFPSPYPTLTVEFSPRTVNFMRLVGDDKREEYPVDFIMEFYNDDGELILTDNITGNTGVIWEKRGYTLSLVTKIILTITKWSHPGRQVKILEFFPCLQQIYEGDDLFSISLLEEREYSDGALPIGNISSNEITVQINNLDRRFDPDNTSSELYGLVSLNKKVEAWIGVELLDGSVEYVPLGTFFCGEWSVPEDDIYAEVTADDRLALLDKSAYSGPVYQNVTLYQLAIEVLNTTGFDYYVDEELKNYTIPWAYFDDLTHRECLRTISEACGGACYVSRDDVIRLEGPSYLEAQTVVRQTITNDNYVTKDNQANYENLANYIVINTQPLTPAAEPEDVYTSDDTQSITAGSTVTISVEYSKKPVINALAILIDAIHATIKSVTYYAWGADVTVYSAQDDTFTIKITGITLSVENSEQIIKYDALSIRRYGKMEYDFEDNCLVQTKDMAQAVAIKTLTQSKTVRSDLDMDWQGNPALELGNLIAITDRYQNVPFWIISQQLDWDGGLTCTLKGKRKPTDELNWNEFEEINLTWDKLDGLDLSMNQLEVY